MCLYKEGKGYKLKQDLYVLKSGLIEEKTGDFISSPHCFRYEVGKTYKKDWLDKYRARFRTTLKGEVFHAFGKRYSYSIAVSLVRRGSGEIGVMYMEYVNSLWIPPKELNKLKRRLLGRCQYGLFMIPEGTTLYGTYCESNEYSDTIASSNDIGATSIKYLGHLTLENAHLILGDNNAGLDRITHEMSLLQVKGF